MADAHQFTILAQIVQRLADPRVWVYAELIGAVYQAKDGATWRREYHGATLYVYWLASVGFAPRPSCPGVPQQYRRTTAIAGLLYNLTDEAIRACPPSTQWVVATNGDNLYARGMFQTVMDAPANADVIALDYYSRYQRTTGPPCARFAKAEGAPPCKQNRCASVGPAIMCF